VSTSSGAVQLQEQRDEDRRQNRPLGYGGQDDQADYNGDPHNGDEQGQRIHVGMLDRVGQIDRGDRGKVAVVEVCQVLADDQKRKHQAPGQRTSW
jgi:hypothetical protein